MPEKKPKNVRNFWVEITVDGLKKKLASGPRGKKGGFSARIFIREKGEISSKNFTVTGESGSVYNALSFWYGDKLITQVCVEK